MHAPREDVVTRSGRCAQAKRRHVALIRRPANWIKAGLMLKSFRSGRRARSRTEQVLSISF